MKEKINRRRFVALAGTTTIAGTAGCFGDDEPTNDGGEDSTSDDELPAEAQEFDFPVGADESGVVKEILLSGAQEFLAEAGRYRTTQKHEFDHRDARTDTTEIVYDVSEHAVHEQQVQDSVEIDRWVTPQQIYGRSVEIDGNRAGRWQTDTVYPEPDSEDRFIHYPFEETTVPDLLSSASFEFDQIVTDDDGEQSYARYAGDVTGLDRFALRRWNSARISHHLESASEGHVSLLLAESGAIRTVEYEVAGQIARVTRSGSEVLDTEVSGEVRFEYDDLDDLTPPEWVETSDSDEFRELEVRDRTSGRVYELRRGPLLPGARNHEYAEIYASAQFDDDQYVARFTKRMDFEVGDHAFVGFDDGEFVVSQFPISGENALEKADRVELSVYLFAPGEGRTLISHEDFYP